MTCYSTTFTRWQHGNFTPTIAVDLIFGLPLQFIIFFFVFPMFSSLIMLGIKISRSGLS